METKDYKELTIHGSSMFPLKVYSRNVSEESDFLPLHWHDEIEIIYVEDGEMVFNVDMQQHTLTAGQCIFINRGMLHSAYTKANSTAMHYAIVFNLNILSSSLYDSCQNRYIDPLLSSSILFPLVLDTHSKGGAKILIEILDIIDHYTNKTPGSEISIKASLYKIIAILADDNSFIKKLDTSEPKDYKVELMKIVLNYIHSNYNQKLYLEELAEKANMNTHYFCRFFKSIMGTSPVTYINHYRIEQAAKMLKTSDYKVLDICYAVGFDNFSYFIKKFKEYKNCTPSQFKN